MSRFAGHPVARETALHAWLVRLLRLRLKEIGWTQRDLSRATGMSCNTISGQMVGDTRGSLRLWERMLAGAAVTLPDIPHAPPAPDLQVFLVRLLRTPARGSRSLYARELAELAGVTASTVSRMTLDRDGGSLVAWQQLLDAAGVAMPDLKQTHATRR